MSDDENHGNLPPQQPVEPNEEPMEEEDEDEDDGEIVVELLGNFVDGFEIANAFRVDEVDSDDDEENGGSLEQRSDGVPEGAGGTVSRAQTASETYDKCLPSKHLYLGHNVEEVRGHQMMPDDFEEIEIPLFPERNFALVPGQVIPLTVFDPVYISLFQRLIEERKDFGVRFGESTPYGTMAQIFEYCPERSFNAGMSVKARGRHRFKVVSIRTTCNGVKYAKVRVQPEVNLPPPMHAVRFHSLNRLRLLPVPLEPEDEENVPDSSKSLDSSEIQYFGSRGRRTAAKIESACSPWPSWVYKMYDEGDLARRVRESVPGTSYVAQNRNKFLQTSNNMPADPAELSHWVARSLPFPESDRIVLLQFNSAVQRLRYELSLTAIDKFRTLGCAVCGREIAKQGDVIAMSEDGPQGVFVNMGGYIHDILTFSKLTNKMRLRGRRETDFSWFPGYAWRIAECPTCGGHLGWKFNATDKKLVPAKFYAVLKNKIAWSMRAVEDVQLRPHS